MNQFRSILKKGLAGCHEQGVFVLSSGNKSKDYYDLAPIFLSPESLRAATFETLTALRDTEFDALGCIELCPTPLVGAVLGALPSSKHGFIVRKAKKGYGTDKLIEGSLCRGDKVVVLEDVTSTGQSVLRAVHAVEGLGCKVVCILTIINRQEGCDELLKDYNFRRLFTKGELNE